MNSMVHVTVGAHAAELNDGMCLRRDAVALVIAAALAFVPSFRNVHNAQGSCSADVATMLLLP